MSVIKESLFNISVDVALVIIFKAKLLVEFNAEEFTEMSEELDKVVKLKFKGFIL